MSNKTYSEQLVEGYLDAHKVKWRRIKEAKKENNKRPDYAIKVFGGWCILEVKEIKPNDDDKQLIAEARGGIIKAGWVAPGKRARKPIQEGERQLRKFAQRHYPTVVCLFDMTASFHDADFHIRAAMCGDQTLYFGVSPETGTGTFLGSGPGRNATLRWNERTTVSAVAVLRQASAAGTVVDLYHNPHAAAPIREEHARAYVRNQSVVAAQVASAPAAPFDLKNHPDYAEFFKDPDTAFERIVREILDEGKLDPS